MEMWRRRGEAASTRLSAALYSVYSGLYSEAVVSSVASAVAHVDVGRFREAVQYVQKAAKTLYEGAREVFEHIKITVQRLVELFVEAVARVLAWIDEHKAYLFLMAAVATGAVALSAALNLWGLVELEKLAYAASALFVAGLADAGGRADERFRVVADRWRADEKEKQKIEEIINEVINAPQKRERPFSKLTRLENLPPPLAELRKALKRAVDKAKIDEAEKDAAVVAALVLYKTLINNAGAYGEWAGWYKWVRGLVEKQEFVVTADKIRELREAQRRLEEVAEEVRRELNAVLALYASHSRDLYEKLRPHLEVDLGMAEELAEARIDELSGYGGTNMGTKAYAALLSVARGGIYRHAAMFLEGEGALADIVISTPEGAYEKAKRIAGGRGETVHPSYSRRGAKAGKMAEGRGGAVDLSHVEAAGWEERAASVLLRFLIGYGEAELKFRHVEKGGRKGFQMFRTFGGIEAPVGELWIGKVTYFKVSEEELRRLMEEAKKTAPDLSEMDRSPQYVAWRNTDVTSSGKQIVATTVHPWQLRWYFGLLGEPESFSGGASVTKEDIKPFITAYWPREREDQILGESRWLESLLGRRVESWRELVDAVDWSWVLKRVEELADELKPWIGPEKMDDAERERLARRMLGELELLVHFAEARRGVDDSRWREERAKRLAEVVEALSSGRIAGEYAERLARAIIYYAEGYKKYAKKNIESLAGKVGVSMEEVWGVVEFVLSDMYCLARDCARDEVVRKFVEPALELIMLDKALNGKFDIEEARLLFGEMYATALAGDGTVGPNIVMLTVGGELGGGAAFLRLATLHLLNELLPKGSAFDVQVYIGEGRYYRIATYGENTAGLMRLLAVTAPTAGGEYLSPKFNEFVEAARVEVRLGDVRPTKSGIAADLIISEAGIAIKYNVYLRDKAIELRFQSTDRSRAELAALLLMLAGVGAEVKREGDEGEWYVRATTDKLAAAGEELREALAEIVKKAMENGWVDKKRAERWLKKLERGYMLMEGWPKYEVKLVEGALVVSFRSTNLDNIKQETQRFREMGLEEGRHFSVKMPEGGKAGYVYIRREGLAYAAWLSENGSERQRELAAKFVKYILQRAEEKGENMRKKVEKVVEGGETWASLTLEGFEKKVEVNGSEHMVKVLGWSAELEEGEGGRKLLRIKITAEVGRVEGEHTIVDRVVREYTITFGRYGADNAAKGLAVARADVPGGREEDAERLVAVIKALTGREPKVYRMKDGTIKIEC